jgi:hypothetical protein
LKELPLLTVFVNKNEDDEDEDDEDDEDDEEDEDEEDEELIKELTTDSLTVHVDIIDFSVHHDVLVTVLLDLVVPCIYPLFHPECEGFADDAVDDVDDVLPIMVIECN